MTRRADPERIRQAHAAGDAARAGERHDHDEWVRRLPPASNAWQREQLLESLSPTVREAAAAWVGRKPV